MGEVMKVSLLTTDEISRFWSQIQDAMLRVEHMWADKWTLEYIYQAAMAEHIQVWGVGEDAIEYVAFTDVIRYPANGFLRVLFIFGHGDIDKCVDVLEEKLQEYAAIQGCRFIEVLQARKGWERKLHMKSVGVVLQRSVKGMLNG
jgi:hypothetical protein